MNNVSRVEIIHSEGNLVNLKKVRGVSFVLKRQAVGEVVKKTKRDERFEVETPEDVETGIEGHFPSLETERR